MSRDLTFVADDVPGEYLDDMIRTGLWGESEAEVLNHLLLAGIRRAIGEGFIRARSSPNAYAPQYKCDICEDGACGRELIIF